MDYVITCALEDQRLVYQEIASCQASGAEGQDENRLSARKRRQKPSGGADSSLHRGTGFAIATQLTPDALHPARSLCPYGLMSCRRSLWRSLTNQGRHVYGIRQPPRLMSVPQCTHLALPNKARHETTSSFAR